MTRLSPDELKDAMVTLHPQPAMEHLHHRFLAADGAGSDALIAFEATEVAATHRSKTLVPVRPAEPLAGAPDRGPIPLADNVSGGVAAVTASAGRAKAAAGGVFARAVTRIQDLMPHRRAAYRRVTTASSRRETQRRAAVAILAMVVVIGGLASLVYSFGGPGGGGPLASVTAAESALRTIRGDLGQVFAPGVDLVEGDPSKAMSLLSDAYRAVDAAKTASVPPSTLDPLRQQVVGGLDRLFHVVPVGSATVMSFAGAKTPFDIQAMILGPDGMPYVLDKASNTVYRIDLRTKKATPVFKQKTKAAGATEGVPKLLATGGRDLLIIDDKNTVWRWRAADAKGNGTIRTVKVAGAPGWGDDVVAAGTFLRDATEGLYNLYIVDPSEQNILAYTPARDGSGFPVEPPEPADRRPRRLEGERPRDRRRHLRRRRRVARTGSSAARARAGRRSRRATRATPGTATRSCAQAPDYAHIASASDKRTGVLYAWDKNNGRVVAYDKAKGTFIEQYRLAGGSPAWDDVRGMYVVLGSGPEAPSTLVWATKDGVMSAVLEAVPDAAPGASGSPNPSASAPAGLREAVGQADEGDAETVQASVTRAGCRPPRPSPVDAPAP